MGHREDRIAQNEAVFRLVNERTVEVLAELGAPDERQRPLELVCECGDASCLATVVVGPAEYESARSDPRWFLVARGHEMPDVETVVDDRERYLVVEKHPGEDEVARASDPRG